MILSAWIKLRSESAGKSCAHLGAGSAVAETLPQFHEETLQAGRGRDQQRSAALLGLE
jgi:hypothetical protein